MRPSVTALGVCGLVLAATLLLLFTRPPSDERPPAQPPPAPRDDGPTPETTRPTVKAEEPPPPGSRLAVLIVFDQLRGDYLVRWRGQFVDGGFRRLMDEGAWFSNCHYDYAHTVTAAGHASLSTGCPPSVHGVVGNEWYDNKARTWVYATNQARELSLVQKERKEAGPDQLLAPTIGDLLEEAGDGGSRVVSLSLKDRSAILMAGRDPRHLCLWQDIKSKPGPGSTLGMFKAETNYYSGASAATLAWLRAFNARKLPEYQRLWSANRQWERLYNVPLLYELSAGPDDVEGEGVGVDKKQGRTFPHPLRWDDPKKPADGPTNSFYSAVHNSPYGNELLLELAKEAIDREQLGRRGASDLLCVSFSSNDLIGHCWGPDSQEVLDVTLRSDRVVRDLLAHLDARLGKGNYTVCLSADHGVCPLPEVRAAQGQAGGRVDPKEFVEKARDILAEEYPQGKTEEPCFLGQEESVKFDGWLALNPKWLAAKKTTRSQAAERLAARLRKRPHVQAVYTRAQLLAEGPPDEARERLRRSFYAERCGDVAAVFGPYYELMKEDPSYRTTHGTPHDYDTHVPLLVYGKHVRPGMHSEPAAPRVAAAVLAHALGLEAPPAAAPAPTGLFAE
jgi:hypothetical protein